VTNPKSRIQSPKCSLGRIVREAIDVPALAQHVASVANGAVCTFVGQVRETSRGRQVAYLEYDAYVPMAEKMLQRIAEEASARWGAQVAVQHRIGRLELGEPSVVVCVGSPHRAEAFEACRWCIDTLKETVPIWKKEVCPDGAFWIEGEEAVQSPPADGGEAVR
jgi:molybdopterin synthase catalytic subunit